MVDFISVSLCVQPSLSLRSEMVVDDGLCLSVVQWVAEMFHFAPCLGESISLFISYNPAVRQNLL